MYDKDNDYFRLSVRNLNSCALCSKPQANRVSNLAWAKDGQALLYVVTDQNRRPYRCFLIRFYNAIVCVCIGCVLDLNMAFSPCLSGYIAA